MVILRGLIEHEVDLEDRYLNGEAIAADGPARMLLSLE